MSVLTAARRRGRARRGKALALAALIVCFTERAASGDAGPESDNALATFCGIVESSARAEGLPVGFFTRLIWRESAFRPTAISPAGAQGVAQFMPRTASERGLADPFDPAAAIPESAKLLGELELRFGNLGLAAAAYNAGPTAVDNWLADKGALPFETQDYVLAITGHSAEDWRGPTPPSSRFPRAGGVMPEPGRHPAHRAAGSVARRLGAVRAVGRADRRQLLARLPRSPPSRASAGSLRHRDRRQGAVRARLAGEKPRLPAVLRVRLPAQSRGEARRSAPASRRPAAPASCCGAEPRARQAAPPCAGPRRPARNHLGSCRAAPCDAARANSQG